MRGALRIARIFGIDVAVHWTFLLLVAWVVYRSWGTGLAGTLLAVAFLLAVFACVVLHEFGHALTARAFGVPTKHITLLPIGGVAALQRMPTQPVQEFLIAIAGPLVNVVIAGVLIMSIVVVGDIQTPDSVFTIEGGGLFKQLAIINIFLVLFNLLPAFPMDGGRILRSLLAIKLEYIKATRVAAVCGRVMALGFAAWAILIANPFLLLIAVFVFFGGQAEAQAAVQRAAFRGRTVGDAMLTEFHVLHPDATLARAADLVLAGSQADFPVVDSEGRVVGMFRRDRLAGAVERGADPETPVGEIADQELPALDESADLAAAIEALQTAGPSLPVVRGGRLVGMLSVESLNEYLRLGGLRRARAQPAAPLGGGSDPG